MMTKKVHRRDGGMTVSHPAQHKESSETELTDVTRYEKARE